MPLPIYLIVATVASGFAMVNANRINADALQERFQKRRNKRFSHETVSENEPSVKLCPSSFLFDESQLPNATPLPGSVVCCEVFHELEHTAVWIDADCIIEFSNNGLIKSVSAERFMKNRSGSEIFVACDERGQALAHSSIAEQAVESVFTYQSYDLFENNCHSFVASCLGAKDKVVTFSELNSLLLNKYNSDVYWDKVKV